MNTKFAAVYLILTTVFSAPSGVEDATFAAEIPDLEGIWTLDLEGESISMVVYQFGSDLAGACTGEYPEPWNAVMTGSIMENEVDLFVLSIQNGACTAIKISGKENEGEIGGNFAKINSLGFWASENLTGFKTSPDTSAYEPATPITHALPLGSVHESTTPLETADEGAEVNLGKVIGPPSQRDSETGAKRIVDVTSQAERVFYLGWAWNPN